METHLTIKHLAGYLPYGLKMLQITKGTFENSLNVEKVYNVTLNNIEDMLQKRYRQISCKPILRPLSDLTKEIEHNGEKFVPIIELLKLEHPNYFDEYKGSRYSDIDFEQNENFAKCYFTFQATKDIVLYTKMPLNSPYWIIEKLYEWHFDIHGLIEKGLAIDINTVK